MKIKQKLTLGFVSVAILVVIVGYLSVSASQKALQKQIGEDSVMKPVVRSEIAATIRNVLDMKEISEIC